MLKLSIKTLYFCLAVITTTAFANDCQTMDKQLATFLENSNKHSNYGDEPDEQKLDNANDEIAKTITNIAHDSTSMACHFSESQEKGLHIVTSVDNKFRAFSWDNNYGGTMREFVTLIQFIDNKGISHAKSLNSIEFVTSLFSTAIKDKATYLLVTTGVYSTKDTAQILSLYQIDNDKLSKPKLIKTKQGLTNVIGFEFDFSSVIDRPERLIELFEFDKKSKTILFPVVVEDKDFIYGNVTNRKIRYQFDGKYFVKR